MTKLNDEVELVQQREREQTQKVGALKKLNSKLKQKLEEVEDPVETKASPLELQHPLSGDTKKLADAGWTVAKVSPMKLISFLLFFLYRLSKYFEIFYRMVCLYK